MSQNDKVLSVLKKRTRAGMTAREFSFMHDIDRAAARVKDLRYRGHPILTIMEKGPNGKRWARYFYVGK